MQSQEHVFSFLKDTILELKDLDESDVQDGSELQGIGLDSLDFIEVQVMLKRRFGVQINPAIFASGDVRTLGDFSRHVASIATSA